MVFTFQDALAEINHHGVFLSPQTIGQLQDRIKAVNAGTATAASPLSKKRKADIPDLDSDLLSDKENNIAPNGADISEEEDDIDSDDDRLATPKWSCGQVRAKIRKFVEKDKVMKVSEFQNAIGVSGKSYYAFMKQNGAWAGSESNSFIHAHRFFMKRELLGLNKKGKKGKGKDEGNEPAKKKSKTEAASGKKTKEALFAEKYDVSSVSLPGEAEGKVAVYDQCDEIRKKINAVLREPNMTRAAFCREISKTWPDRAADLKENALQGRSLASFLSKKGSREGRTSLVFYASYVFFEKLRIRDGKPKTQFREEMEDIWGPSGFDIWTSTSTRYLTTRNVYLYTDKYGKVRAA
ncbi:hypothetical protein ASPVEDRAFT_41007 [Aspergillus versicolor CBS 583.65]|uniref:DUF7726 domain-containing protein n=1 Tax=Aspergillus versicolor CBS 583.65 TaxID=1036611 RepID=A0A1L9PIU2_ASPVE|nr:uncharacterized protein ASPVEDRAFT_41007 [Aspergillus versicolor CBS 583.65]OJJ01422.1 hypothetical protein ASPVEDRAFT_41007 [Aspergillus versicolor CBS 583.65]